MFFTFLSFNGIKSPCSDDDYDDGLFSDFYDDNDDGGCFSRQEFDLERNRVAW